MANEKKLDCNQQESLQIKNEKISQNEKRIFWVLILTLIMMFIEILAGSLSGSMGLLADGWHMASDAAALLIAYLVYRLAQSKTLSKSLSFGTGKLLPLGGYTSALGLGLVALVMGRESILRLLHPVQIHFDGALIVACIGLGINLLSIFILGHSHGDESQESEHPHEHVHGHTHDPAHEHETPMQQIEIDHNHASAYSHVIADALTSVTAIVALVGGKYFQVFWLDPVVGILGSAVILYRAYTLCRDSGWELLDGHAKNVDFNAVKSLIQETGAEVIDLHIWKLSPSNLACQMVVATKTLRGADYYKQKLASHFTLGHIVIEEHLLSS